MNNQSTTEWAVVGELGPEKIAMSGSKVAFPSADEIRKLEDETQREQILLPKNMWTLELCGASVIAGIFEYPPGYRNYEKYPLSELPNDFISINDLESFSAPNTRDTSPC